MLTFEKCMQSNLAYIGVKFTVVYAIRNDESIPALDFFNGLDPRWQGRFITLFTRIGGGERIHNTEQFNKFLDEFWEFKAYQFRMPCYYRENRHVVITHGFIKKKEGSAPKQEGERAHSIKREYEERLALEAKNRRTK